MHALFPVTRGPTTLLEQRPFGVVSFRGACEVLTAGLEISWVPLLVISHVACRSAAVLESLLTAAKFDAVFAIEQ